MVEWHAGSARTVGAEWMNIAVADACPVHELDSELERGLCFCHQIAFINPESSIEKTDVGQRGFTNADRADLTRLNELDLPLLGLQDGCECRGCHPACGATAYDHDAKRTHGGGVLLGSSKVVLRQMKRARRGVLAARPVFKLK